MSKTKTIVAVIIALIGYQRYIRFINFIDKLQLELNVISVNSDVATLTLSALNVFNVPYKIMKINFLIHNTSILAFTSSCIVNKKIVKNSTIPIHVSIVENGLTKEDLQNSEIEMHYVLLGFSFKRKYNPKTKILIDINQQPTNNCGCGCS